MPNVEEKARVVDELRARFEKSPLVVLTEFKGATVKQLDSVRRGVEKGGVKFQVVKNTLCWRALQGTDKEKLAEHFRGNIGVMFSTEDPIATAKLLKLQLKDSEKIVIKVGFFEGAVLDKKGVEAVAEMAGREEMLGQLLSLIQEGPRQLLSVIQAGPRDLAYLLQNFASTQEGGS